MPGPPQDRDQSTAQPVLYSTLVDVCNLIEEHLVKSARVDAREISDLLLRAYTEGLTHGFQQGVQAAAERARKDGD